ncbi:thiol-disulfide oxidoreductase DCC family protein [Heyndrickxia sporothermodurans]|uniref:Thiol-disulfide oxidoreductase DCC family protein n=1 Tax=Heyndrickxia sporothermodurans TaxID=46224 RepID=A0AB37HJ02_9BACI|nr:thiol-disulfide oxidoreductase DCC family protein [Heyndrickxia sporothermodurans]MBL5771563.1 thiol-disulfide oxidoreductase DCC family protein [Heyndrickxia sporothermodurans]MBL5774786.1 thiol-disulfide oxidoreductase DCC family protein [Heyndrickxia sporothermodurans]MBL5793935.1 thiol-disulfide oxidoreductase DCC family protein [Heyndrickxia sporothermodurans]MBL5796092.1 thiol-disulfide oxidoreductase DCC family protein [Heyndrickxia sporothermodurans]MBL5806999.1 thiol-disulfide oxid
MGGIILFDGVCNFCNSSVQFIMKRDPKAFFKFASLQSETGKSLLLKYQITEDVDSLVLIEDDSYFIKSSAILRICTHLRGLWKILSVFRFVPTPMRNILYDIIAKNRYRWFGKKETCMIPSKEERRRFLDYTDS